MKHSYARIICLSAILAAVAVQVYAHHGNQFLTKAMEMNSAEVQLGQIAKDKAQNAHVKEFAEMMITDHTEGFKKIQQLMDARTQAGVRQTGRRTGQDQGNATNTNKNTPNTSNTNNSTPNNNTAEPANMQLNPEHRRTADRLKMLSGADFDREFIAAMIRDHRLAINTFEQTSRAHGAARQTSANQNNTNSASNAKTDTDSTRQKPDTADKWSRSDYARDMDVAEFARETLPTLRRHLEQAQNIQKELGAGATQSRQPQQQQQQQPQR
jgi:predicted outer membrane protein